MAHRFLTILLGALAASLLVAQAPPATQAKGGAAAGAQSIQQVKPGFYVVTGGGGNTGVRVTSEGLIVTDVKNPGDQFYNALMEQIKSVSNQPVKFVINTHHHADHTGNNQQFLAAGAQVIGHENLKTNLANLQTPQKPALPSQTYAIDRILRLGGAEVRCYHYARGHTSGDTVVYYPDLRIVQMGDLFVAPQTPNIDYPFGGSAMGWRQILDRMLMLDFDTAVPGHGAVMTKADLQAYRTKFDTLITRALELVRKGTPKDQLMAQIKTDDLGWNVNAGNWVQPARLDGFYDELSKVK